MAPPFSANLTERIGPGEWYTSRGKRNRISMADVLEQIESVSKEWRAEVATVKNAADLEAFRIKFLGSNGKMKALMKLLGTVPKDQKPAIGQKLNTENKEVTGAFDARKAELEA